MRCCKKVDRKRIKSLAICQPSGVRQATLIIFVVSGFLVTDFKSCVSLPGKALTTQGRRLAPLMQDRFPVVFFAVLFLMLFAHGAYATCADGRSVRLSIEVEGQSPGLEDLLRAVSRLAEKDSACAQSVRRLDGNLRADIERFGQVLRSEGYYDSRIDHRIVPASDTVEITIRVLPGVRYRIGVVQTKFWKAEGQPQEGPYPQVSESANFIRPETPALAARVVAAEGQLLAALHENGYTFADSLDRSVIVDHKTRTMAVTYNIVPGGRYVMGAPVISGLETVEETYLLRLVPWQDEELFRQSRLEEYRSRLLSTGLFRTISIDVKSEPAAQAIAPEIALKESSHRRIELGAGYAAGEGFEGEASWQHRNFLGEGESLKLSLLAGESEQQLSAHFRKPNWRRYDQALILRSRLGHETSPAYSVNTLEGFAGLERRLSQRITGSVGASARAEDMKEDAGTTRHYIFATPVGITFDGANSVLDPTRGVRLNARVRPVLSMNDEDSYFLATELRASAYLRVPSVDNIVLAARGRIGNIWGAELDHIPDTERFYAGGGGSVRGFGYQRLGPQDADETPSGGRSVAELSFEARLRVSESISVVPFLDGGMVYENTLPKLSGFRWGAGLGFRYHTAFAPIRLDLATPLDRREGESRLALYISIGQSF